MIAESLSPRRGSAAMVLPGGARRSDRRADNNLKVRVQNRLPFFVLEIREGERCAWTASPSALPGREALSPRGCPCAL